MSTTSLDLLAARPGLAELNNVPLDEALAFFATLEAFPFTELDGRYNGVTLDGGDPEVRAALDEEMRSEDSELGFWLGKAYRQLDPTTGDGINLWRRAGQVVHQLRFTTHQGAGHFDQKPCLVMDYSDYDHRTGEIGMVDEVRKVEDDLYYGIAHINGPTIRLLVGTFALIGPSYPYTVEPGDLVEDEPKVR